MDDVLNRELFRRYAKNRPAKAALSSMGGILASSPELMQAANQYANGGMVGYAEGGAVDSGGFNMMDIIDRPLGMIAGAGTGLMAGASGILGLGADLIGADETAAGFYDQASDQLDKAVALNTEGFVQGDAAYKAGKAAESAAAEPEAAAPVPAPDAEDVVNKTEEALDDPTLTDKEKAEAALEAAGLPVPSKTQELIEAYKKMLMDVYKVDPAREKRISGLNQMLMGHIVATGKGTLLENVMGGLSAVAQARLTQEEAAQTREDSITSAAVSAAMPGADGKKDTYTYNRAYQQAFKSLLDKADEYGFVTYGKDEAGNSLPPQLNIEAIKVSADKIARGMMAADEVDVSQTAGSPVVNPAAVANPDPLQEARDAIRRGANPAKVKERLEEQGISTEGL